MRLGLSMETVDGGAVRLEKIHATALLDAAGLAPGRLVAATSRFEKLAAALPDDGEVQEGYATALAHSPNPEWPKILAVWRVVLTRSQPQSPRWYRAKLGVATALAELGQKDRAAEMVQMLQVLHPELGGSELAGAFEGVLQRCQ